MAEIYEAVVVRSGFGGLQCPAKFAGNRRFRVQGDPTSHVGYNGFARLYFCGPHLEIEYADLAEKLICCKERSIDTKTGEPRK